MELKETEKMRSRTKVFEREVKSSWFFVLSDAVEFYPAKPPALHFDLDLRSDSKHLPEDLRGLGVIYGIALLGMAGTFAAFVVEGYRRYQTSKSVRARAHRHLRARVSVGVARARVHAYHGVFDEWQGFTMEIHVVRRGFRFGHVAGA